MDFDNFVFYGSWRILLESLPRETAKEILWQLMLLGTAGDIDTEDQMIQGIILGTMAPNVKAAKDRYAASVENGKKGGRPKKEFDLELAIELREQGMSYADIAKEVGVSKETVRTALAKNQKPTKNLDIDKDIDTDKDIETEKDIDSVDISAFAESQLSADFSFEYTQEDFEESDDEILERLRAEGWNF